MLLIYFAGTLLVPAPPSTPAPLPFTLFDVVLSGMGMAGLVAFGTDRVLALDPESRSRSESRLSHRVEFSVPSLFSRRSAPSEGSNPSPPEGYGSLTEAASAPSSLQRTLLGVVWILPSMWVLTSAGRVLPANFSHASTVDLGWPVLLGIGVGVVIVHEAIHALAALLAGCYVSVGILFPHRAYVRPAEAFLTRRSRVIISLLPNIMIAAVGGVLLAFGSPLSATVGLIALVITVVGGGADLYNAVQTLRTPPGELRYRPRDRADPTLVCEPNSTAETPAAVVRLERSVLRVLDRLKTDRP